MFTVIIVVCSLKSMCIPSLVFFFFLFFLSGYCVSELHGHLHCICPYRMYGLKLFIVVLQNYIVYQIVYMFV